jgi:hypothetical protein
MTHKFFFGQELDLTNIQSISEPHLSDTHTYFKNNPYSGVYYLSIILNKNNEKGIVIITNYNNLSYKIYERFCFCLERL